MSARAGIGAALALALTLGARGPVRADEGAPDAAPVLLATPSGYLAGLAFDGHPFRDAGVEAQARVDLSRGARWGAHAAYTYTGYSESEENLLSGRGRGRRSTTQTVETTVVASYHDLLLGGRLAPFDGGDVWVFAEAHALLGESAYAGGFAGMVGAGVAVGVATFESGVGGVDVDEGRGLSLAGRTAVAPLPWLEVGALALVTDHRPIDPAFGRAETRFAFGADARLGPFGPATLDLRWLGGERALAMDHMGRVVENLPDIMGDTLSAIVSFAPSERSRVYFGGGLRFAAVPPDDDYVLGSVFVGGSISF